MEILLNNSFGEFSLSPIVLIELLEISPDILLKDTLESYGYTDLSGYLNPVDIRDDKLGTLFGEENDSILISINGHNIYQKGIVYSLNYHDNFIRTNKDIIKIVKSLGSKSNGKFCDIRIIEIPDDLEFYIDSSGTGEEVHEIHRMFK